MAKKTVSAYPMSIRFMADTADFDDSVSQINKKLKDIKGELAAVNKILMFDPKNTEMQKAKLEILNQQVQKNTQKQKMYKDVMDGAKKGIATYTKNIEELKKKEAELTTNSSQREIDKLDKEIKENIFNLKQCEEELRNATIRFNETGLAIARTNKEIDIANGKDLQTNLKNIGKGLGTVSKTLTAVANATKVISAVSSGALVGATKSAMDFEQQWVAVKKVLRDDADFEKVKQEILDMGKVVPTSLESITQAFANASQLGVSADNLSNFVETILRLDSATNISSDEASLQIAQLFNAMGSDVSTVDKFASAIVHLGNNTATTEKQILDMAEGLGAAAKLVGFTDSEVLGLASALSSIGLEAAAGGSSVSRTLTDIDKAMSGVGKTAKERVGQYAKLIGKSVSATKDLWDTNPAQFFTELVGGLNEYEKAGGNVNVILSKLGITNIRQDRTLKGLINSYDNLTNAMELANIGYEDGTKHIKESNEAWDTLKSKLQLLTNSLLELGITFGNLILPIVTRVVEKITSLVDSLASLDESTKETILKIMAIAAIFSPLVSLLAKSIGFLSQLSLLLSSAMTPAIMGFLTTVAPIVAIVGAFVAVLALAYANSEKFRNKVAELGQAIAGFIKPIIQWIIDRLTSLFNSAKNSWGPILVDILTRVVAIFTSIIEILTTIWTIIEPIVTAVWEMLEYLLNGALGLLLGMLDGVVLAVQGIVDGIKAAVDWFAKLIGKKQDYNDMPLELPEDEVVGHIDDPSKFDYDVGKNGSSPYSFRTGGLYGVQSNGIGTLNLATSINVTNNGTPLNEVEIRRWGETITDVVSTNLGRRL